MLNLNCCRNANGMLRSKLPNCKLPLQRQVSTLTFPKSENYLKRKWLAAIKKLLVTQLLFAFVAAFGFFNHCGGSDVWFSNLTFYFLRVLFYFVLCNDWQSFCSILIHVVKISDVVNSIVNDKLNKPYSILYQML